VSALAAAWKRCFTDLGIASPPQGAWEDLKARYSEPHRAYHTLQHLEECFAWFEQARSLAHAPGEVALALFYHDAIYDTHASDSEAKSAALAGHVVDEYARGAARADRITELILATKHDAMPKAPDAQLLVDIDLAILGAVEPRFDEYERQVRFEYQWVAEDAFRAGRKRILEQFLARPALYDTAFFRERLEAPARANLARSIAALG
jgi:predicted metal-dependent HD superfamily phosphohydrolase